MTGLQRDLGFIPRLEALRGLAAVSVVAYHAFAQFIDSHVTGLAPVVLFFVLSGFVLARSLARGPTIGEFFRHRVFRLFPAAIAAVLLLTALHAQFGFYVGFLPDFSTVNVLMNALMLKHDINGPMWSMTVEILATPLILLSFWICRRHGWRTMLPFAMILFGLSFIGPYVHLLGGFSNLAPLYAFIAGVMLHFAGSQLVKSSRDSSVWIAALFSGALLLYCGFQKQTAPIILLETISSGGLIAIISFAPISLFSFLDAGVSRFFGQVSYSFYLLHMIGLSVALRITSVAGWPVASAFLTTVLAIALTTPLAWLSWRYIERPFVRWGRSFGQPAQVAPEPAA